MITLRRNKGRVAFGAVGVLVICYGALRLLQDSKDTKPFEVAKWLVGAVVIHDGILAPITVGIGWLITRYVPGRARAYVQSALATAAMVSVVAWPLIHRRGKSEPGTTLERQNYGVNLAIVLGIIAAAAIGLYAVRVIRDGRRASSMKRLPASDQSAEA